MSFNDVSAFAQQVHQHEWCVQRLPTELGARRFVREVAPDLLGVAVQGRRLAIGLNAGIIGTPLELPVLAHECGHLLLGHDIGYCSTVVAAHALEERAAWESAALLTISRSAAVSLIERRSTVHDLAAVFEVPRALVIMRVALAVLLNEVDGNRERARQQLAYSRRSLESWMARLARDI